MSLIDKALAAFHGLLPGDRPPMPLAERYALARHWGRFNLQSVVRHVPRGAVFVHCHECRWPVNPGRTHMLLGNGQSTPATEEQMERICQGVRAQMGVA